MGDIQHYDFVGNEEHCYVEAKEGGPYVERCDHEEVVRGLMADLMTAYCQGEVLSGENADLKAENEQLRGAMRHALHFLEYSPDDAGYVLAEALRKRVIDE